LTHRSCARGTTNDLQKTTLEAVLRATGDETNSPILVYATDAAMQQERLPLSAALQTFVKHDNRLFKQSLIEERPPEEESPRVERKRLVYSPNSPSKRVQRSDSLDSMASNRASLGDDSDRDIPMLPDEITFDTADDYVQPEGRETPLEGVPAAAISHDGWAGQGSDVLGMEAAARHEHSEPQITKNLVADNAGLGTEMIQLAISKPLVPGPSQVEEAEKKSIEYMADWDHPDGKPVLP